MERVDHTAGGRRAAWRRYLLFQTPGWVLALAAGLLLHRGFGVPVWIIVCCVAIWVTKDLLLFPWVWEAYEPQPADSSLRLVGVAGVATTHIANEGYVRIRGELWAARLGVGSVPIEPGEAIRVVGVEGLCLVIESGGPAGRAPGSDSTSSS